MSSLSGDQGIHVRDEVITIPAPLTPEVDPTGSGDIFAAAFFVRLQESGDLHRAGEFATRVATSSISAVGLAGIPSTSQISTIQDTLRK
jgi:sugar/nucleoside kinase (ribokinase family)